MPHTIQLAAELAAPPDKIFDAYLDKRIHAAITGAPAAVAARPGAKFSAFGGTLSGIILQVVPKRLIVQSWRASHWPAADLDSTLIITLKAVRGGTLVELVHANVPEHDFAGVSQGWELHYWAPWRDYLKKQGGAKTTVRRRM